METPVYLRTTGLARQIAAAGRAGVPVLPGRADVRGDLAAHLDAVADAIEDRCNAGEPVELVVAREARRLPPALAAVLATAASGGDGHAALLALQDAAERGAASSWRWWLDVAYPLLVCALATAGLAGLAGWYGPLIAAVDDTLRGPRAGAIFDARPVVEAVRVPAIAAAIGATALALGWMLLAGRRQAADAAPRGTLSRAAAAIDDPEARRAALATVADHERMVAEVRGQSQTRLPAVFGSIVAGLAVLLYGIALFKPLVTVMQRVAEQPAVEQWRSGP